MDNYPNSENPIELNLTLGEVQKLMVTCLSRGYEFSVKKIIDNYYSISVKQNGVAVPKQKLSCMF